MSLATKNRINRQLANERSSETRDFVTVMSALAGAILFLAVPEFGIPVAIAAAGLGLLSAGSALTKPKANNQAIEQPIASDRRTGSERRVAAHR
jgi:hypothetical protein